MSLEVSLVRTISAIALLLLVAACGIGATEPTPEVCDGIAAELGGCDGDRPTYSGTTCAAAAEEFLRQFSDRGNRIIDGPAVVDGNERSSQLVHAMVLHVQLANKHLRDTGQVAECEVPEFLEAAVAAFSPDFTERVGAHAFPRPDGLVRGVARRSEAIPCGN